MMILVCLVVVALMIKLVLIVGFVINFKKAALILDDDQLPTVSILVAARNEESVLAEVIESLLLLDYPQEKIEILLGNDNSTDGTEDICAHYTEKYSYIHTIHISENYHDLIAKANVIAQLTAHAKHDLLAIIDADMRVKPGWLRSMVSPTIKGYDMVSGFSEVRAGGLISAIQRADWMNGVFVLKALSDMKYPVTVLGNNMLISQKAYRATGGFEAIGPSATEDNDITLSVVKHGFRVFQQINRMGATTEPIVGMDALFSQRKRWILGGLKHSFWKVMAMFISRSFMLWAILLTVWQPYVGFWLLALYLLLDLLQLGLIRARSGASVLIFAGLVTPFFNSVFDTFALLKMLFSRRIVWKERNM